MATTLADTTLSNFAQLWDQLGNVPLERISIHPAPGTATVEDVLRGRHRKGQKHLFELVHGVLVEKDMGFFEARLAAVLLIAIGRHLQEQNTGIVVGADGYMRLSEDCVRIPDAAYVSYDRLPDGRTPRDPVPELVPDLAVEVLSRGNTPQEMERKLSDYFDAGVRQVWILDPSGPTLRVHDSPQQFRTLGGDDTIDGGEILPGFTFSIREWFEQAG